MQPTCTGLFVIQVASVLIAVRMVAAELACQDSGYCSPGSLTPFVGDLYPSNRCRATDQGEQRKIFFARLILLFTVGEGLHQALKMRSHKQEVMLFVSDLKRLDDFLQVVDSLQKLGLSNVLLLSYSQDMCESIIPFVPDIGCAWSSHKHPEDLQGNYYVWSLRYRVLAR